MWNITSLMEGGAFTVKRNVSLTYSLALLGASSFGKKSFAIVSDWPTIAILTIVIISLMIAKYFCFISGHSDHIVTIHHRNLDVN